MKAPILALIVAAAAFAGSSVYFWTQLREERARAVQVEATTRELNQRIAELEKARTGTAEQRTAKSRGFIFGQINQDSPAVALPPTPPVEPGPEVMEQWANNAATFQRPEALVKMMRSQMRGHNKRQYADFCEDLGLDKATTDQLISLLTDQEMKRLEPLEGMSDFADYQRHVDQLQRENEQQVADLIGPENAKALKDYQESLPARMEVEMFAQQLEGNDVPLSNAQVEKLYAVYIEERARVPQPELRMDGDSMKYLETMGEWQKDYNRRVSDRVSSILNSEQLGVFNEIRQWQDQMQNGTQFAAPAIGTIDVRAGGATDVVTFAPAAAASAPVDDKKN